MKTRRVGAGYICSIFLCYRPGQIKNVFRVTGLKILGRVATPICF